MSAGVRNHVALKPSFPGRRGEVRAGPRKVTEPAGALAVRARPVSHELDPARPSDLRMLRRIRLLRQVQRQPPVERRPRHLRDLAVQQVIRPVAGALDPFPHDPPSDGPRLVPLGVQMPAVRFLIHPHGSRQAARLITIACLGSEMLAGAWCDHAQPPPARGSAIRPVAARGSVPPGCPRGGPWALRTGRCPSRRAMVLFGTVGRLRTQTPG